MKIVVEKAGKRRINVDMPPDMAERLRMLCRLAQEHGFAPIRRRRKRQTSKA